MRLKQKLKLLMEELLVKYPQARYIDIEVVSTYRKAPAPSTWAGFSYNRYDALEISVSNENGNHDIGLTLEIMAELEDNRYFNQQQKNIISMIGYRRKFRYINPLLSYYEKEECKKL